MSEPIDLTAGGISEDLNVRFFFEDYKLPKEILPYIKILSYFSAIDNELDQLVITLIEKNPIILGELIFNEHFKSDLTKIANSVLNKMFSEKIFSTTLDDLLYNNPGYNQLLQVCINAGKLYASIEQDKRDEYLNEYLSAERIANSKITGSGVSVWTSSVSTALLYTAFETSTLRKQEQQATFELALKKLELQQKTDDKAAKRRAEMMEKYYYPGVRNALQIFNASLFQTYVTETESHGYFNYSAVKKYDVKRSNDLLNNLDALEDSDWDKEDEILRAAFCLCPFNIRVYVKALEKFHFDEITFTSAPYLVGNKEVENALIKHARFCATITGTCKFDQMLSMIRALSVVGEKSENQAWKEVYQEIEKKRQDTYDHVDRMVRYKTSLIPWVRKEYTSNALRFIEIDDDRIALSAKLVFYNLYIREEVYQLLVENGLWKPHHADWINGSTSLKEIDAQYVGRLQDAVKALIIDEKSRIKKCELELDRLSIDADSVNNQYDELISQEEDAIYDLETQQQKTGFWHFGKKTSLSNSRLEHQNRIDILAEEKAEKISSINQERKKIEDAMQVIGAGIPGQQN